MASAVRPVDSLAAACFNGDLPSAEAAVADGASVNEDGCAPDWAGTELPLAVAVLNKHFDVVVWLLSHGADSNGDRVMWSGATYSTSAILQLLIDAGGDVHRESWGQPPLIAAVRGDNGEDNVRVLLAQPSLDFTTKFMGKTPEQYARDAHRPALADMITRGEREGLVRTTACALRSHEVGHAVADRLRDEPDIMVTVLFT